MTDTTTSPAAAATEAPASLTLPAAALRHLLAPALRIAPTDDTGALRTVEIHVTDGWVIASATDRYRTVVHRMNLSEDDLGTATGPFTVILDADDLQHLLALAGTRAADADLEDWEQDTEATPPVTVTISTTPGQDLVAVDCVRPGPRMLALSATYPRGAAIPGQASHPARRLTLEALALGYSSALPPGVLVAADLLGGITEAAGLAAPGCPVRLWSTSDDVERGSFRGIGWSAGEHLLGLLMPVTRNTDSPNLLEDPDWAALAILDGAVDLVEDQPASDDETAA